MNTTPWHERPMVAFDLETTGTNPEQARIVTAAVVTIDPTTGDVHTDEWLANPGLPIPQAATDVHGVTTDYATEHGQDPGEVAGHISDALHAAFASMRPLVVFNAAFDLTLLDRELRRHGGPLLETGSVVDPLVIDKACDRYRKGKRTLTATAEHYGVPMVDGSAHGAGADALAAARVAWRMSRVYPDLADMRLTELHAQQIGWRAQQQAGLADYFRRQGKTAEADGVSSAWPLVEATVAGLEVQA